MSASADNGLLGRVDAWVTLRQPVTYWSFWARLLKVSPLLVLPVLASVAIVGDALTVVPFAPTPYVFVAATLGFAVRRLRGMYVFTSLGIGVGYTIALALQGVLRPILATHSTVVTAIALLTFVAGIAGFASPSLHRGYENTELARRQRSRGGDR